jgi:hypothetical protein
MRGIEAEKAGARQNYDPSCPLEEFSPPPSTLVLSDS